MSTQRSSMPDTLFSDAQKEYLTGFFAGLQRRYDSGVALVPQATGAASAAAGSAASPIVETWYGVPVDEISKEEGFKRQENPWGIWEKMARHAAQDKFPEGGDVFRFKFHGLFYVAPAQNSFMLRVRIPACQMSAAQMQQLGDIAAKWGGGYGDVTTRGNIQIREIQPKHIMDVLQALQSVGLINRGAGADNVRNITATPTSGLDPQEVIDVLPQAKALQHLILNEKDLFGLPRKFNIAFESGGSISTVADTNDIAFIAARVPEDRAVEAGIYFRVQLAGITGHGDFARGCDLLLKPEESVAVAAAMLRVYAEYGDRTNRKRARMKYLIDDWGVPKFLQEVEKRLAFPLRHAAKEVTSANHPVIRHGHIGIYRQKQRGLNYLGLALPVGRLSAKQMHKLADFANRFGSGELRSSVWQNILIPNVPDDKVDDARRALEGIGLGLSATSLSAGLVACTGNTGCKFSATNTKGQGKALVDYLNKRFDLDTPINIHLTGCPHSCAQHYISDIGLLGAQVGSETGGTVEGYHVFVGGGTDQGQSLGRQVFKGIPFSALSPLVERMLKVWLAQRRPLESFAAFTARYDVPQLQTLFDGQPNLVADTEES